MSREVGQSGRISSIGNTLRVFGSWFLICDWRLLLTKLPRVLECGNPPGSRMWFFEILEGQELIHRRSSPSSNGQWTKIRWWS